MIEFAQTVLAHHRKLKPHVTKNKLPSKDKMNSSNNYNLWLKCYINLFNIVSSEMRGSNALAVLRYNLLTTIKK